MEIFLESLMCGVTLLRARDDDSDIGTNDWTVNITFSQETSTNCSWIAVSSILGCFCRDATHSWWLTFQMSVAGWNAITNLSRESFYSSGVSMLMLRIPSLKTFSHISCFLARVMEEKLKANWLVDNIEEVIDMSLSEPDKVECKIMM